MWKPAQSTASGKKKSVSRRAPNGIKVHQMTPTEGRELSEASPTYKNEEQETERLSTQRSQRSKKTLPSEPVIIAKSGNLPPDETPNILEEKKQPFESVVEN